MAIAAAIGALGSLASGAATIMQAQYQSAIAQANAQQAQENAKQAIEMASRDAQDIGVENAGLLGEQVTGMGATGVALSSPSFIRSRHRAQQLAVVDQQRRMEAGYKEQANYLTQSNMFQAEASAAKSSVPLIAASAALGAVGSFVGDSKSTKQNFNMFQKKPVAGAQFYNRPTNQTATYLKGSYAY